MPLGAFNSSTGGTEMNVLQFPEKRTTLLVLSKFAKISTGNSVPFDFPSLNSGILGETAYISEV